MLLTDILLKLKVKFRSLALRIDFVNEQIETKTVALFEKIHSPEMIEGMLKQKDVTGKTVLQYLAELKIYRFLQIQQVNRIISSIWQSKTDTGGSVCELATSYNLTFVNKLDFAEDNERRNRFYEPRTRTQAPEPH